MPTNQYILNQTRDTSVNLLLIRFICMFCYVKKLIRTFYLVLVLWATNYAFILGLVVHFFFAYYIT